MNPGRR
ncbi:Protein of unknown function [Lactobacillus delbrueckii subsp. lactis]|nr:Protein of unknown function [Lactobacillus delbrueckii subsp. lactis]